LWSLSRRDYPSIYSFKQIHHGAAHISAGGTDRDLEAVMHSNSSLKSSILLFLEIAAIASQVRCQLKFLIHCYLCRLALHIEFVIISLSSESLTLPPPLL
jgi:hypothetical protein